MKNIYIIFTILSIVNSKAQTIIGLENQVTTEAGHYYKDINNFLNTFEGTYLYTNGTTSFKIVLQKKIMSNVNDIYTEDILIGGYQYIKDGIEKVNTLSMLSIPHVNGWFYSIHGNNIMTGKMRCPSCETDEKWIATAIVDPIGHHVNELLIRKTVISGQPAIKVFLYNSAFERALEEGEPLPLPITHPINTELILLKL